jgi:hypothetical protein
MDSPVGRPSTIPALVERQLLKITEVGFAYIVGEPPELRFPLNRKDNSQILIFERIEEIVYFGSLQV